MHRFYLPPDQTQTATLTLSNGEAHHALHVLRLQRGDRVTVLDGCGHEFLCEIDSADRRSVTLAIRSRQFIPPLPYELTLIQAIPKGKNMESIVQKAAELGVHRIVPILSERTVTHLEEDTAATKAAKWQMTAVEAIKQCGSAWLPQIDTPSSPQVFLARQEKFELPLVAALQKNARHPREHVEAFQAERQRLPQSIAVWVGPEGDFTPAEINSIMANGALPITLGQLILRSETAAIYCLAVLNYELQAPRVVSSTPN